MIDPERMIDVAILLVEQGRGVGGLGIYAFEEHFRRGVSTAYYALFHKIAGAAAAEFADSRRQNQAAYRLIYRGLDHRQMKSVFKAVQGAQLNPRTQTDFGRQAASQSVRDVASAFVKLQDARHTADYDPSPFLGRFDVAALVDTSSEAIAAFDAIERDERRDLLALLLVGARG